MSATTTYQFSLPFAFIDKGGTVHKTVKVANLVIAGWTGRDSRAVEAHVRELEALGVPRPRTTPIFYRAAAARLTPAPVVDVTGKHSSGEVEIFLFQTSGQLWVGVGSDHTDRNVEAYNVTVSKQMCDKPVATSLWRFDDVADHWDDLILESRIVEDGQTVIYQQGSAAAMLPPAALIERYAGNSGLDDGTVMFCGTLGVNGAVRPASQFSFSLNDPVLGRTIAHSYAVQTLPVEG